MKPEIKTLREKKLIGKRMKMSLSDNKTHVLWQSFLSRRKEIQGILSTEMYSLQLYDPLYFKDFSPDTEFDKFAAVEVTNFDKIPDEMEAITLPGGLYAIFVHIGGASTGPKTFKYIFESWLPNSGYILDNRFHFEVLTEKYKNEDPTSKEEIWIPIRFK